MLSSLQLINRNSNILRIGQSLISTILERGFIFSRNLSTSKFKLLSNISIIAFNLQYLIFIIQCENHYIKVVMQSIKDNTIRYRVFAYAVQYTTSKPRESTGNTKSGYYERKHKTQGIWGVVWLSLFVLFGELHTRHLFAFLYLWWVLNYEQGLYFES